MPTLQHPLRSTGSARYGNAKERVARSLAQLNNHKAIACRPVRAARRLCAQPANVAAGLPPSPPPPSSPSSSTPTKNAAKVVSDSPSLPMMLAGLSSGVLLGAAALHLGSAPADHASLASAAASAVAPLKEFGPADVIAHSFGPTRPLWSALLHSHTGSAASSTSVSAAHYTGAAGGNAGASLVHQAHAAAEDAAAAARGAVADLCDDYNRWLKESPLLCKIVTGNFFTVAGDMLAQLGLGGAGGHGGADAQSGGGGKAGRRKVDLMRTGRLCLETSAIGTPLGHWWFNLLDSRIMPEDPHCPAAVLTKTLADQVLFAPLGLLMFFAVIKCLEGRPRDLPHTLRTSYVKTLLGGYLLWPVAGILNFALLPNEYRLLFNNCVNIIWTCFLSIMSTGSGSDKTDNSEPGVAAAAGSEATAVAAMIETAVLVAAVSAAASGRSGFGYLTGLAAATIEVTLSAYAAAEQGEPAVVPMLVQPSAAPQLSFAAGASVAVGSPCLELCEQPVDALYEIR